MKQKYTISIKAGELRPALTALAKVASSKPTNEGTHLIGVIPITKTSVKLTGSDGKFFLSVTVEAEAINGGDNHRFGIPLSELQEKVKGVNSSLPVTVALCALSGSSASNPPSFKASPAHLDVSVGQSILKAMLCASSDPARQPLNGAFLDVDDDKIVGTDGRHLYECQTFGLPGLKASIILPDHKLWTAPLINTPQPWSLRVAPRPKDKSADHWFRINGANWSITGPLIDLKYPAYKQVIPDSRRTSNRIRFTPQSLEELELRIKSLPKAKDCKHLIGIKFERGQGSFLVRGDSSAEFEEIPMGVEAEGPLSPITIFFSQVYFTKGLGFGLTELEIIDEISPVKLRCQNAIMVLMPMRLNSEIKISQSSETREVRGRKQAPEESQPAVCYKKPVEDKSAKTVPFPGAVVYAGDEQVETGTEEEVNPLTDATRELAQLQKLFKSVNSGLLKAVDSIKQAGKGQRETKKEVRSLRGILRSLGKMRLRP